MKKTKQTKYWCKDNNECGCCDIICNCECHSPSVTDRNNRSKGWEGEESTKRVVATDKPIGLSNDLKDNSLQDSSPSSFDKLVPQGSCLDCYASVYCINEIKSIVERDYIEKQKVKDFLKNKREKWENSIDMSPYGIAREQQKLVLKELEKELMKD